MTLADLEPTEFEQPELLTLTLETFDVNGQVGEHHLPGCDELDSQYVSIKIVKPNTVQKSVSR